MREFLVQIWEEYNRDEVPRRAAALSFYTILSLAPLLLITIAIAGIGFGEAEVQERIVAQVTDLIGERGGQLASTVLQSASSQPGGIIATLAGLAMLLIGASGVFSELRDTLNRMWEVERHVSGWRALMRERLFSFALVLAVGFLLIVSLVASAAIAAASGMLASYLAPALLYAFDFTLSFVVVTLLFAALYKALPQTHVPWRPALTGATVASALFIAGKLLIGLYLGKATIVNAYGAAGSLVVILLWAYFSSQIFFIGAEIAQVKSRH